MVHLIIMMYAIIQVMIMILRSEGWLGESAQQAPHGPMTETNRPRPRHLALEGKRYISLNLFDLSKIGFHLLIHSLEIVPFMTYLYIHCFVSNS